MKRAKQRFNQRSKWWAEAERRFGPLKVVFSYGWPIPKLRRAPKLLHVLRPLWKTPGMTEIVTPSHPFAMR
jgi:hypothetical protein